MSLSRNTEETIKSFKGDERIGFGVLNDHIAISDRLSLLSEKTQVQKVMWGLELSEEDERREYGRRMPKEFIHRHSLDLEMSNNSSKPYKL